ncbi:hypothetical protein [Epiphyas postvittana nucleopolyhedrovirus]|uniref:Uncharacterized protein n=1 Tax=Epiphyas postvittana nucleopolyhedrovirus TaxID=70600 RepID=Q91GC3_NPVEP|nr:hypothetical protein [Epiphyas postvittana nucleopolyhedrovirus]AAK85696.1 unknown [Epiphyas postvittana nucleopolyhedrovirus]
MSSDNVVLAHLMSLFETTPAEQISTQSAASELSSDTSDTESQEILPRYRRGADARQARNGRRARNGRLVTSIFDIVYINVM